MLGEPRDDCGIIRLPRHSYVGGSHPDVAVACDERPCVIGRRGLQHREAFVLEGIDGDHANEFTLFDNSHTGATMS